MITVWCGLECAVRRSLRQPLHLTKKGYVHI